MSLIVDMSANKITFEQFDAVLLELQRVLSSVIEYGSADHFKRLCTILKDKGPDILTLMSKFHRDFYTHNLEPFLELEYKNPRSKCFVRHVQDFVNDMQDLSDIDL